MANKDGQTAVVPKLIVAVGKLSPQWDCILKKEPNFGGQLESNVAARDFSATALKQYGQIQERALQRGIASLQRQLVGEIRQKVTITVKDMLVATQKHGVHIECNAHYSAPVSPVARYRELRSREGPNSSFISQRSSNSSLLLSFTLKSRSILILA